MTYKELATIVQKKPGTVSMFFSRHNLSIKSDKDIRFYMGHVASGKRLESGKRTVTHLKPYQFQAKNQKLQRARNLVKARRFTWYSDPTKLSMGSIVEHVFSYGDFEDVQELFDILGKKNVRNIFEKQLQQKRSNYRPVTRNFFTHYFHLSS